MKILGAGLSGLLAASMLRHHGPLVLEKQQALPDNHGGVLRFPSPLISEITGIPFQKVTASKWCASLDGKTVQTSTLQDRLAYSSKVLRGFLSPRSISSLGDSPRFLAPKYFPSLLARGARIEFGHHFTSSGLVPGEAVISTLPMPALMSMLAWQHQYEEEFQSIPIYSWSSWHPDIRIDPGVSFTIYFPDPETDIYRMTVHLGEVIVESMSLFYMTMPAQKIIVSRLIESQLAPNLSLDPDLWDDPVVKEVRHGKLLPVNERWRREFIHWATSEHNIYSLGRFATWKPGLLLDGITNDVRVIQSLIEGDKYYRNRATQLSYPIPF